MPDEVYVMIEAGASKSFAVRSHARTRRERASPLTWLNLVCLDAPLVAVAWQSLFARSFGIPVAPGATCALFLTAWLIYLGDRFGDSLSTNLSRATALRQRFCRRFRTQWIVGMALVATADLAVVCALLNARQLMRGALIGVCALAYLAVNRTRPTVWRVVPLKEVSIGFLFAAGTMVPLSHGLTSAMWRSWLLFACLCALNCICIAVWERYLDVAQQRVSVATAFPVTGFAVAPALAIVFAISASFAFSRIGQVQLYSCLGASAALLALLHLLGRRAPQDLRTALADIALLTPLVSMTFR